MSCIVVEVGGDVGGRISWAHLYMEMPVVIICLCQREIGVWNDIWGACLGEERKRAVHFTLDE